MNILNLNIFTCAALFVLCGLVLYLLLLRTETSTTAADEKHLTESGPRRGGHAVVVGGSIAGCAAARILFNHYDRVTILESEEIDPYEIDRRKYRSHVPQDGFTHVLTPLGRRIMEGLFPGLCSFYMKNGAIPCFLSECQIHLYGGFLRQSCVAGTETIMATRQLFEGGCRNQLLATFADRLDYRTSVTVRNLLLDSPSGPVKGVIYLDGKTKKVAELRADLVIDATGRAARGISWLKHANVPFPPVETYEPFLFYTNAAYAIKDGEEIPPFYAAWGYPGKRHEGVGLLHTEGNECLVLSASMGHPHPPGMPQTDAELEEWLQKCPSVNTSTKLKSKLGNLVSGFRKIRVPPSKLWRYDLVNIAGFVAIGDAVCSVNPIYGQGMTCAAMGAATLSHALRRQESPEKITATYHRLLHLRLQQAWMTSQVSDLAYEAVQPCAGQAKNSFTMRLQRIVFEHLARAAHTNIHASRCFFRAISMIGHPYEVYYPRVLLAVLKQAWQKVNENGKHQSAEVYDKEE